MHNCKCHIDVKSPCLIMLLNIFTIMTVVILPTCTGQDVVPEDYVYPEEKLLKAQKFNQTCEHEGQCSDHRLACYVDEQTNEKRCLCVKYHSWDVPSQQCLVAGNISDMLADLVEQYDSQAAEGEEANKIFLGMLIAGFLVLGIGLVMAGVCTFIACYRPKDDVEYVHVCRHQHCSRNLPSTSGIRRPISPRQDGAIDFIPGVMC